MFLELDSRTNSVAMGANGNYALFLQVKMQKKVRLDLKKLPTSKLSGGTNYSLVDFFVEATDAFNDVVRK